MLYLSKNQIKSLVDLVGQPKASVIFREYYYSYCHLLNSDDMKDLYDDGYFEILSGGQKFESFDGNKILKFNIPTYTYLNNCDLKEASILDVGCGTGDLLILLAPKAKILLGVDFAGIAIDIANEKKQSLKLTNLDFININIDKLSSAEKFDYILLNDVTEHISDKELYLLFKTIKRIIKNSGKLIIHTPNGIALCNDTSFSVLQSIRKKWKNLTGWKGFEWTIDQMYYGQQHINVKSFKNLKSILSESGFDSSVIYDEPVKHLKFLSYLTSSNMIVTAKLRNINIGD
jgi:2-polyprenyl-3-methyl-5-hydroxy-6-metoxy-1,4-benzoquinol methylase